MGKYLGEPIVLSTSSPRILPCFLTDQGCEQLPSLGNFAFEILRNVIVETRAFSARLAGGLPTAALALGLRQTPLGGPAAARPAGG